MTPAQRTLQQLCLEAHAKDPASADQQLGLVVDVSEAPLADALGSALVQAGVLSQYDPADALSFVGLVTAEQAVSVVCSVGSGKLVGVTAAQPGYFVCVVADDDGLKALRRPMAEWLHASTNAVADEEDEADDDVLFDSDEPSDEAVAILENASATLFELYIEGVQEQPDLADTHLGLVVDCDLSALVDAMTRAEFTPPTPEQMIAQGGTLHVEFCHEDEMVFLLDELGFEEDRIDDMLEPSPGNLRVLIADATGVYRFTTSMADFLHPRHEPDCPHHEKPS